MRKIVNSVKLQGRVYEHNLAVKTVQNKDSENFGKEFINGTLDVATDDDCLNVVTVSFTYVTELTKSGSKNNTYTALKNIIENGKTVITDGKDAATKVKIDTALALNDFYSENAKSDSNKEGLISAKRCEGGFVSIVSKLDTEPNKRNSFVLDMVINGTRSVEADPEKNIAEDYLVVKGAVFNFRNSILPIELICRVPGGIKYFESLDANSSNPVFTKVWGTVKSENIVTKRTEESAFGEPIIREYTRSVKEWSITGCSPETYEIGDAETGITADEIKTAMADRNTYLADVKKRQDEYQASKSVGAASTPVSSGVTAAQGGFNF